MFDAAAQAVRVLVVARWRKAPALGGDHRLDAGCKAERASLAVAAGVQLGDATSGSIATIPILQQLKQKTAHEHRCQHEQNDEGQHKSQRPL